MRMKKTNRRRSVSRGMSLLLAMTLCGSLPMTDRLCFAQDFSEMSEGEDAGLPSESDTQGEWEEGSGTLPASPSAPSAPAVQEDAVELSRQDQENGMQAHAPEQDPEIVNETILADNQGQDNPRPSMTVLDGIDISNWQKTIDLNQIQADFIICKATGGVGFKDKSFDRFAQQILSSGRLFGFYHFANDFGYEGSPEEEAAYFYSQTEPYIGLGIPILDYEDPDLLRSGSNWALRFLEEYERLSGVKCMVYMSSHYARSIDWTQVADAGYPLWVANYGTNEEQIGYRNTEDARTDGLGTGKFETYYMHQYTSRGKLDGYEGNLDLNKFYGSVSDWQQLMIPAPINRPMFRLYNMYTGEHFYTGSRSEYRELIRQGWHDESIAWIAPKTGKNVYRLLNPNTGDHHYTTQVNERDDLIRAGWRNEGVGWVSEDEKKGIPVYRVYNPNAETGAHHFTLDHNEIETLVSYGWSDEGVAWYALDPEKAMETMREEGAQVNTGQEVYRNSAKY